MGKLEKIKELIEEIKTDCEDLERKGLLTERGKGQLEIIRVIEEELNK